MPELAISGRMTPRASLFAILTSLAVASCSSTRLVTQWQAPSVERITFSKILALALAPEEPLRRVAEEDLCDQVTSVACKPAYLAIPASLMGDVEQMKAIVKRAGFDGALVFRVAGAEEKVTYVPPSYGPTFWGYYRYAHPIVYEPGYYRSDKFVRVETSIYSLSEDRLLWVATTETMNPESVDSLVEDVAKAVRRELERAKLIPER
jgi:hypothetical protein